jgi:2'-5' RNA ligase
MRLFLALDLPDIVKDAVEKLHDSSLCGAQWTTRNQWHITLHFIGERADDSAIRQCLEDIESASFAINLAGVGQFPKRVKPKVLWAGIYAPDALQHLHAKTGKLFQSTGYEAETRPYKPHLTLARFNRIAPSRTAMQTYFAKYSDFKTESFAIMQFTLYEIQLLPSGAVYIPLEQFPLHEAQKP